MGNRDVRKREVKKPKKQTPKVAPPRRDASPLADKLVKRATDSNS